MKAQPYRDHPFDDQLYSAIIRAYQMERPQRVEAEEEPEPQPLPPPARLPGGVDIYHYSKNPRARANVYVEGRKYSIGYFDTTPEGIEQAGRAVVAARLARDNGGSLEDIKRAGRTAGGLT